MADSLYEILYLAATINLVALAGIGGAVITGVVVFVILNALLEKFIGQKDVKDVKEGAGITAMLVGAVNLLCAIVMYDKGLESGLSPIRGIAVMGNALAVTLAVVVMATSIVVGSWYLIDEAIKMARLLLETRQCTKCAEASRNDPGQVTPNKVPSSAAAGCS